MTRYEIVSPTPALFDALASTMRAEDRAEVWAAEHLSPLEGLRASAQGSAEAWVGLADGEPVCAFGCGSASVLCGTGLPWLLTGESLPLHGRVFLRASRVYIADLQTRYAVLTNFVDARYAAAVKWLSWLGFQLQEPAPIGPDNALFRQFIWKAV